MEELPSTAILLWPAHTVTDIKGLNLAGFDASSGQIVRLFDPRLDLWSDHFVWEGARLVGISPIGRVTVQVLAINAEDFLQFRAGLWNEGASPP